MPRMPVEAFIPDRLPDRPVPSSSPSRIRSPGLSGNGGKARSPLSGGGVPALRGAQLNGAFILSDHDFPVE